MPKKVFNPRSYGNPNKVVSTNNNTYEITINREKFIRSYAPMTNEQKQAKKWSAPTSMAFVTAKQSVVTIGKDVEDQKTENIVAPATVSPVVHVTDTTHNTITLSLDKPTVGTLTGYMVETYIGTTLISTNSYALDGSATIVVVSGLSALTTYNLKVYSTNTGGAKSATPTIVPVVYTLPTPPSISIAQIQTTSFVVSFSAPPTDVVYDLSLDGVLGIRNYVSGTPITGLTAGTQYPVIVRARSVDSANVYTGLVSLPVSTNVWTLLNAPTVSSVTSTPTSIQVGFATTGTSDAGAYQNTTLQTKTGGSVVSTLSTTSASTVSVSGLTADTAYDLSLVAHYANTKTASATTSRYTYPIPPNLAINVVNNNSAQLSFTQLFNHVYDISAIPASGVLTSLHNIGSPYVLNSLTPSMSYTLTGTSKYAASGLVSALATIPFITTATAPVLSSVTVNSDVSAGLQYTVMNATASSGALSTVRVVVKARTLGANPLVFNTTNTTTTVLSGLTPNTVYDLSMISMYAHNQSDMTTTSFTTQPSVPTGLTIANLSYTSTRVFFAEIAGLAYDVSAIPNVLGGGANFMSQTDITSGFTITGLSEGTSYNVFLYARNAANRSHPATQSSVITLLSAPTGLSVSNLSYTSMRLNYTPVSGLAYDVTWSNYSGQVGTRSNITSGEIFTGLEEGTTYTFSLTARKDRSSAPTTLSTTTLLHSPADLTVTSIDYTSFVVGFTQLPSIYQYDISCIPASADANLVEFEVVNTGEEIVGLTQGMNYTVYLHAHTRDVKSQPTTRNFITLLEAPTGVSVSDISYDSVTVHFDQDPNYTYTVHVSSLFDGLSYLDVNTGDRLTNLSQGTSYTLGVKANTPDQVSDPTTVEFNTVLNSSDGLTVVPAYTTCLLTFDQANVPGLKYDLSAIPLTDGNAIVELVDISSGVLIPGLTEGAYYTIYLTTYTADIRNAPASIDFNTLLSMPTGLTISDISYTVCTVTFDENPDVSYNIQAQTNEMGGLVYEPFHSGDTMEGLPQGLMNDVYLEARSRDGITSVPADTYFLTLLEAPKNVVASNVGTDGFTMYFNPPFPDPEYNVYYDASAHHLVKNTVTVWQGVYTGYVANGLDEGSPYRLYVNAWTDDGAISTPDTFDFITHITMPTGLSSTDVSFKSFRVWYTPLFGFSYDISAVPTSGAIVSATDISGGYLFNNTLQEGMTYTVQLYAKTAYIRSPAATMSVTTTLSPPQDVSVSDTSYNSFNVNFTQNVLYNYDVAVFDLSGVKLLEKTGVDTGVLVSSADSASIVEGHQYNVNVYTRSAFQISSPTTVSVTTLLSAPTDVVISSVGYYEFDVTFTQIAGLVYDISAVSDAGAVVQYTGVASGAIVNVATQGILYNVYVRARTAYQQSLATTTTVITELEAPSNFVVDTVTYSTVTLHFDVSAGLVYDLSAIHSDGTVRWIESVTPNQVITGLSEGVAYSFYLYSERYGYKYSPPALATATTLLSAPAGLTISDISMTSLRVNFTTVAGLTYDATVSNGSTDTHSIPGIQSGDVVSGLLEGELYTVSVIAKTVAQTSNASTTTAITLLSAPTNVSIASVSYGTFVVNADSVSGIVYDVSAIAQSNANRTQVAGYTLGANVTVPYDGVTYDVYVYARSPHIRSVPVTQTVTTLLHEPTGLAVSQVLNTSAYYTFTTVAGLTYSAVFHPSSGSDVDIDPATPGVTVTGLISATAYTVSLYAHSAYTVSAPTTLEFVTYTNSPARTSVESTETTITVSYFPFSADADTGAFVQTDLRAVPRGSVGSAKTAVGDLTTAVVTGLTRGVVYDLSLVATYANTKSMPLLDNSYTIVNAPVGLSVSSILNTSCVVSFTVDADLTYDMSAIPVNGVGATVATPSFSSGATVSGLTAGTGYVVYLRGYTVAGIYSEFAMSLPFITQLGSITGVSTSSTETTMTLTYTTPVATADGGALVETDIAAKSRTDASVTYTSGDESTAQLTGLVVGTVYDISMVAVYANTQSLTATLVANTGVSTPTNVVVSATGSTTASVAYDTIVGYTYDISAVPVNGVGATVTAINHVYGTGLTGLTQATKYRVNVYAKSGGFRSSPAYSDIVTYFTSAPTNGGVTASETQLTITYVYPTATADSGVFQKLVIYAKSLTDGTSTMLESNASPAIYGGLAKGTVYDVSMIAMYTASQSAVVSFTTNTTVAQPTGLAVAVTDTTATVAFTALSDVYYDLSAIATGGNTVTNKGTGLGVGSGTVLTGLSPARSYTVYAFARSVGGILSSAASISGIITNVGTITLGTPTSGTLSSTVAPINVPYTVPTYTGLATSFTNITATAIVRNSSNSGVETKTVTATTYSSGTVALTSTTYQGTTYDISATAYYNTSSYKTNMSTSAFTTPISAPSAPTITASAIYDTSFAFAIVPYSGVAYTNVAGYDVSFVALATNTQTSVTGQVSGSNQLFTGLVADSSYSVALRGVSRDGVYSPYATSSTVWTKLAPISISSVNAYGSALVVNYSTPAKSNDGTAFGSVAGSVFIPNATTTTATATGTTSLVRFSGLTPGTVYDLSLVAIYGSQRSVMINRYTGYSTNYLMMQLYNKTATIGTTDAAGNSITTNTNSVAMLNDAVRGFVYNFGNASLLKFDPSPVRQNVTLAFWIKYNADAMKSVGVITSKYFPVYFDSSGSLNAQLFSSAATLRDTTQPYHNEWVHYAITVQSNASNGDAVLYDNGIPVSTITANTNLSASNWGTVDGFKSTAITFGAPNGQATNFVNTGVACQMDDIRVYATTYTATDISSIFVSGLGSYAAPQQLVAASVVDTSFVLYFQMLSNTCIGRPVFNGTVSDGTNTIVMTDISSGYVVSGLTAGTAYTVTLNYTLNGITSPNATLAVTTATIPTAPTELAVTGTAASSVTVGYTPVAGTTYYDISATTGSKQVSQRFLSNAYTAISTSTFTQIATGKVTNTYNMAITQPGPYRIMFVTGDTPGAPVLGLQYIKCINGVWDASFSRAIATYDTTPSNGYTGTGIAITPDGSRFVISLGSYDGNHSMYMGDARPLLYGTSSVLSLIRLTSILTNLNYTFIALTRDGSRLVATSINTPHYSTNNSIMVSTWNSGTNTYNAPTYMSNGSTAVGNFGLGVSSDGERIAYARTVPPDASQNLFVATWNPATSTYINHTAVLSTNAISRFGARYISFLGDGTDTIVITQNHGTVPAVFYTMWNTTTQRYNNTLTTLVSSISADNNNWSSYCDLSGIYLAPYGPTRVNYYPFTYTGYTARTSYQVYGLTAGSAYNFQLSATNANRMSSLYSSVLNASTSFNLTITSLTATSLNINGDLPAGTTYSGTVISGGSTIQTITNVSTGYLVTGLTSATTYTINLTGTYNGVTSSVATTTISTPIPITFSSGTNATLTANSAYTLYRFNTSGSITLNGQGNLYYVVVGEGGTGGISGYGAAPGSAGGGGGGGIVTGIINQTSTTTYTCTIPNTGYGTTSSGSSVTGVNGGVTSFVYNSTTINGLGGGGGSGSPTFSGGNAQTTTKGLTGVPNVTETGASSKGANGPNDSGTSAGYSISIGSSVYNFGKGGASGSGATATANTGDGGGGSTNTLAPNFPARSCGTGNKGTVLLFYSPQ